MLRPKRDGGKKPQIFERKVEILPESTKPEFDMNQFMSEDSDDSKSSQD